MNKLGLLLVVSVLCATVLPAQNPPPARIFQEAIHLMETRGDYPAALRLFEQVAKGSDRNLAARSLLYAGSCYEKLGKRGAQNAYERLIRDFADQSGLVSAARKRLAALTTAGGSPAPREMAAHRVLADLPAFGALSPDGHRLSYFDWDTSDFTLLDLESKQKRSLTRNLTGKWLGEAYSSVHSPDGKQIAYAWWNAEDVLELRVVGLNGTEPRVVYRNADLRHLDVADWSTDGRSLLCTLHLSTGSSQIALVSVGNGSSQVLKTFEWPGPGRLSLSPDGRYVAYDFGGDVFLLAVRGTHEAALVENPASDFNPIWTPDGSRILFTSDRTGSPGIWVLSVAEGKPLGAPELLRADLGKTWPLRFARGDTYFYGVQTGMQDVYVAEIDPKTGKVTVPPSQASRRLVGANLWPEWSRDGKLLAFVSTQPPGGRDLATIAILSLETGKQEELHPRMNHIQRLRWSPDGRSILAGGRDEKDRRGLYRIDAQTGDVSPVVLTGGMGVVWESAWSPDGRTIYYTMAAGIIARDLGTGQERQIHPGTSKHLALSPDGRFLAVPRVDPTTQYSVLDIVALDTLQSRELLRVSHGGAFYKAFSWSADGRFLFFTKAPGELWRVAVENGETEKVGIAMAGLLGLRVHPDGRRIAFGAWTFGAELWAMERFLPPAKVREIAAEK